MGSTKKLLLVAAIAVAVFAVAAPAFAGGYVGWGQVSALAGQGTSPHGGYTSTTVKCQVCHAVHYAAAGGQLLLSTTVGNACNYCHVGGAGGYTQVYNGVPGNYSGTDFPTAHNDVVGGVKCTDCHQVHAAANAMTANTALSASILKATVNSTDSMGVPQAGEATYQAMTKWCSNCHYIKAVNGNATSGAVDNVNYYGNKGFDGRSHVMTNAAATYTNPAATTTTKTAWNASNDCMNCHSAGTGLNGQFGSGFAKGATYNFPHYTQGATNFLESAEASGRPRSLTATNDADGVCLSCHRFWTGAATSGIGFTY